MQRTIYPPYPKRLENLIFCRCLGVICRFPPLIKISFSDLASFPTDLPQQKVLPKAIIAILTANRKSHYQLGPQNVHVSYTKTHKAVQSIGKIEGKLNLWSLSAQHMICMKKGKIFQSYENKSWLPGATRLCYSTALTQMQTIVFLLLTVKWCR